MTILEKVEKMLKFATVLEVDGYLLHNWEYTQREDLDDKDNDTALSLGYTDEIGQIFSFEFSGTMIQDANVDGNIIILHDNEGDMVEIGCFTLTRYIAE
jgi:hypothetical protein